MLSRGVAAPSGRGGERRHGAAVPATVAAATAVLTYISAAVVGLVHVGDWYNVDHVSGVWMGLAQYVRDGVLYPPLFEDGIYGGTRYMPLKTLIDAAMSGVTGEYLVSGKLVGLLSFGALGVVMFVALRRAACPRAIAVALSAVPLATGNGIYAATSNFGDTLSVTLQVAALACIAQTGTRWRAGAAGVLCSLALFAKLNAIWAPVVAIAWLAWRRKPDAVLVFVVTFLGWSAITGGVIELASDDRFRQNFQGINDTGSMGLHGLLHTTPHKLESTVLETAPTLLLLLPLVLGAYLLALLARRCSVYHLALPVAGVVLVLVLNDIGAAENHLLDVEVLAGMVIGATWPWLQARLRPTAEVVAASVLGVALLLGYAWHVAEPTGDAIRELTGETRDSHPANPLGRHVTRADSLLSQDASIPVSLGATPVVLDAYMLLRIDRDHPEWGDALIEKLDRGAFDKVVMMGVPDPRAQWWEGHHLGPRIAAAIFRNYRRSVTLNGYSLYVPRARP